MQLLNLIILATLSLGFVGCSQISKDSKDSKKNKKTQTIVVDQHGEEDSSEVNVTAAESTTEDIQQQLLTQLEGMPNRQSIILLLMPKGSVQEAISNLTTNGGRLVYDPNQGVSSEIPFFIAEVTPDQISDAAFIDSLDLKAAMVDSLYTSPAVPNEEAARMGIQDEPIDFIPTDSVAIDTLYNADFSSEQNGSNTVIAVIDTGVDAAHPAFNGRVDYWYDATHETRVLVQDLASRDNQFTVNGKTYDIPAALSAEGLKYAVLNEAEMNAQLSEANQTENGYLDLNNNGTTDSFLVLLNLDGEVKIVVDTNANQALEESEATTVLTDYNSTTRANRDAGMLTFVGRNRARKVPLIIETEEDKTYLSLGLTRGSHGTHVAGIAAANQPANNLIGAAPNADIISIRVCGELSCTGSAIIKGIYQAFYNGKTIPDVVNVSLGSLERGTERSFYAELLNDLSAKFGTVFFFSASNNGPGFKTLNHFGNSGPHLQVGANISASLLNTQYNAPDNEGIPAESLLYFSSLGPTYTGELKPNIVAPGAAIAPSIFDESGMTQMNGTSMSSPLATGMTAAVISKVKMMNPELVAHLNAKRAQIMAKENSGKTLINYAYAVKASLEEGATELATLSMPQQGFGLVHAGNTYSLLVEKLAKLNNEQTDFFEVILNDYKGAYSRTGDIAQVQEFKLSLGNDGERDLDSLLALKAHALTVTLAKLEIIDHNGGITKLTELSDINQYFTLVNRGDSSTTIRSLEISLANSRVNSFHSLRHKEAMEYGKTYVAHYNVSYRGESQTNIIDVVHRPLEMKEQSVFVPYINPEKSSTVSGFYAHDEVVKANHSNRYFVYIGENQTSFDLSIGVNPEIDGRAFIQVYDPSGREAAQLNVAMNFPLQPRKIYTNTVSTIRGASIQTGLWEVTVSTPSSLWMEDTQYDILIENNSFGATVNDLALKPGEQKTLVVNTTQTKLQNATAQGFLAGYKDEVTVKAWHKSYHPVNLAVASPLFVLMLGENTEAYSGRIDYSLYTRAADGSFEKIESVKSTAMGRSVLFSDLPQSMTDVYFALDTFTNFESDGASVTMGSEKIGMIKLVPTTLAPTVEFAMTEVSSELSTVGVTINVTGEDLPDVLFGEISLYGDDQAQSPVATSGGVILPNYQVSDSVSFTLDLQ